MEYIPIISKEAYLTAAIHDLIHVPFSPARRVPYVLYAGCFGRLLYISYIIERYRLWSILLLRVIGLSKNSNEKVNSIIENLKQFDVYKWDDIKADLFNLGKQVGTLYKEKKDVITKYIRKIFGFRSFFTKLYVIYGFNPVPDLSFGSTLYFDQDNVIIAVYVNDLMIENHVLDLIIHELLHGLIRLNNLELEHDVEELIMDVSAPDGYLSELLGLVKKSKVKLENVIYFAERGANQYKQLFKQLVKYYENGIYDRMNVFEYIKMNKLI